MTAAIDPEAKVFVTGHRGLVGSAIVRALGRTGHRAVVVASRSDLDLRDQAAVDRWFDANRPRFVIHAAGTVGGIAANSARPADFLYDNIMLHATVLRAAWRTGVDKLLYLGSSCIYPRDCPQPIREDAMLTGPLERTNDAYAIAKISGVIACQAYRRQYGCKFVSAMPTNLYGPNDNFDLETAHMLPALIRKFHEAKQAGRREVTIWGTGNARRELLHVDDLAEACLFLLKNYDEEPPINIGTGDDLSVREIANLVREIIHPEAELSFDHARPDGTPRKQLDVERIHALGWRHRLSLREGIEQTYRWYLNSPNPESRIPNASAPQPPAPSPQSPC
jgi:GDP-L-fucose synthase